jgi:hypothetical protein
MTPEEARAALAADEAERIEAFRADFAALETKHGVTVTVQVFITPDGRIDGQVVPVVVRP